LITFERGQSGFGWAALFSFQEEIMLRYPTPTFCLPCIERLQAQCPHLHTSTWGGFHYSAGEVWDDIHEVCDICGANLDELPLKSIPLLGDETIQF
jgi:hypothetical protein